jgi:tetratricopeptide (TPR) repeat protein
MGLGAILVARGHYNAARQVLERSLAVKERSGEFRFRALTYSFLARAYAGQGRCTEGLDAAVEGERLSREFDDRFSLSSALVTTGRLLLANDKVNAARRHCLEAMEVAEETGNRFILAWARIWLANVALAEKRVTEATSLATDALALYQREEMESIDLLSEILLAQGKCALAAGQPEAAEESFRRMQALPRCSAPYRQAAEEALAAVQAERAFET